MVYNIYTLFGESKNNPAGIGIELFSPLLCLDKTLKLSCLNEPKQPSPQSSNNHVSNVAKKLAFKVERKTPFNSDTTKMKTTQSNKDVATKVTPVKSAKIKTRSSAAAAATIDTSAKLSIKIVSIKARNSNTKAKISKTHLTTMKKLNAYKFDWIDARATNVGIKKYSNADKID